MNPEIKHGSLANLYNEIYLAGDIGGTNTNLAFMGWKDGNFHPIAELVYPTKEVQAFSQVLDHLKSWMATNLCGRNIIYCCIAAAGPIDNNCCKLTNAEWDIDGGEAAEALGMPVKIINDFQAICYGSTLLDPINEKQLIPMPRKDGVVPAMNRFGMRCLAGAGTGMGVGYVHLCEDGVTAFPSEGGHVDFAPFDEETAALRLFMDRQIGKTAGVERVAAGPAFVDLLRFFRERHPDREAALLDKIASSPPKEIPRLITQKRRQSAACLDICRLFVKIYARFAANLAVTLLPDCGLFLAGGIAAKIADAFLDDGFFRSYFEYNHKDNIAAILRKIPTYIIADYDISLYGSALCARQASSREGNAL